MAPSRRKGASKAAAAAAAAACRQWKVGDLVLAKLKGFPAWPATVSEPEKWGYSADWKKVLVYFFGTQQIAFCNPADVEAFTEEKKQTLLTKRHGKGSDFVRAVHEIIDSFDKLKKEEKDINVQSSNEVSLTNTTQCVQSFADNSGLNGEFSALKVEPSPKSSDSIKPDGAEPHNNNALHDKCTVPEDHIVVREAPLPNTYSRKKAGGIKIVTQKRAPSVRRSRTSSRTESNRFQNFILSSNNIDKSAGSLGSIRRTKRARRSPPDVPEVHNTESPALVSNSHLEEVTVDSDTHSLNDGSTVESVECCEGDVELSQRLDFIVKKKRKPSRKRSCHGGPEVNGTVNNDDVGAEPEVHKSEENFEKSNGRYSKEDGDEHLPLVKRARVRMSRSTAGEEIDTSVKVEVKSSEVSNSCSERSPTAIDCVGDIRVNENPVVVKVNVDDSSPINKSPINKPAPLWEVMKQQNASCVDVEAALPPSKRLHRALEAMSANAAELGQTSSEAPSTTKMSNGHCSSYTNTANTESGVQNLDAFSNNMAQECTTSGISSTLNPSILEETAKLLVDLATCNKPVADDDSRKHEFCEIVPEEAVNTATSLDTRVEETVIIAPSPKPLSPQQDNPECSQSLLEETLLPIETEIENTNLRSPRKEDDHPELSGMSSEHVSVSLEIATASQHMDGSLNQYVANGNCESTPRQAENNRDNEIIDASLNQYVANGNCESGPPQAENNQDNELIDANLNQYVANGNCESTPPQAENNRENEMSDVIEERKPTLMEDSNATPSPTTEEVARAAVQGPHLSNNSSSLSDGRKEAVPGTTRSSSSPTEGLDSKCASTPPNTSTDNSNLLEENNGCCSPDTRLQYEKPKHDDATNRGEANALLTSFEANLGTLKRTKESISRATRIAIDCAKFGIAPKAMEAIARNLECEPSLHRRIDLFFLVDSITQWSRGLKGDVGGIYPSLIQAKLPRLLLAAAPPGTSALENRRQCLKVLRLWQERRILPESVIRRHIRELDSLSTSSTSGVFTARRQSRTERAFDDPLREMEGMVDEYGSNSSFQLPGFRMPPMVKDGDDDDDEGSDSDDGDFESVTPEHNSNNNNCENNSEEWCQRTPAAANEKRSHILEDVDGELEMEDVAPSSEEPVITTTNFAAAFNTHHHHFPPPFAPPLPSDVPPSSPPLPTSPPPPRPPPPPPPPLPPPPPDSTLYVAIQNIKDDSQQCTIQDAFHYPAPPPPPPPPPPESRPMNIVQQVDGANMHHKPFHLPPPHPAPSNQFSYIQADPSHTQSYPNQFHYVSKTDTGNYYNDHDRMNLVPHDENWRFSAPLSGPCYPENSGLQYAYGGGPPCEAAPAIPSHSWAFPPQPMNHREPIPHRPSSEGPIPAAVRAANYWRPR